MISGYNPEVTMSSIRNHHKLHGYTRELLVVPSVTQCHFRVVPGSDRVTSTILHALPQVPIPILLIVAKLCLASLCGITDMFLHFPKLFFFLKCLMIILQVSVQSNGVGVVGLQGLGLDSGLCDVL